jgi:flagellar biosynthesis protein FlhB
MAEKRPPSPARLRRALSAGDNPLSPFSVRVASLVVAAALLPALARVVSERFADGLRAALAAPEKIDAAARLSDAAWLVAPLLAAACGAAFATGFVQTGLTITPRRESPFGARSDGLRFLDVARAIVLAAFVLASAWYAVRAILPAVAAHTGNAATLLADTGDVVSRVLWTSIIWAVALAAADVVLKRAAWIRRLSPSPDEQKRERRETEGAPEPRRARRRAHEELTRGEE